MFSLKYSLSVLLLSLTISSFIKASHVQSSTISSFKFSFCRPSLITGRNDDSRRRISEVSLASLKTNDIVSTIRGGGNTEDADEGEINNDKEEKGAVEDGDDPEQEEEVEVIVEMEEEIEDSEEVDSDDQEEDDDEEEIDITLVESIKSKTKSISEYDEPYFLSPSMQAYTTFGTILLSRKFDLYQPKIVRLLRFLFIVQLIIQQAFIVYVRIQAKIKNDRTPIEEDSPFTGLLDRQGGDDDGGSSMVKNLLSNFLKKDTTIMEYDMKQAISMQGGIIFNILLMWVLHFKFEQVQPLLLTIVNTFVALLYNPLFQVYIMGRNLERPFKTRTPQGFGLNVTETNDETTENPVVEEVDDEEVEVEIDETEDVKRDDDEEVSGDDEADEDIDSDQDYDDNDPNIDEE